MCPAKHKTLLHKSDLSWKYLLVYFAVDWWIDRHNRKILTNRSEAEVVAAWQESGARCDVAERIRQIATERLGWKNTRFLPSDSVKSVFCIGDTAMLDVDLIVYLDDNGFLNDYEKAVQGLKTNMSFGDFIKMHCKPPQQI